jgi:hypothetical protein
MATLTVTFNAASPVPCCGYKLKYRIAGSGGSYTIVSSMTSPFTVSGVQDGASYEGTIYSDCQSDLGINSSEVTWTVNPTGGGTTSRNMNMMLLDNTDYSGGLVKFRAKLTFDPVPGATTYLLDTNMECDKSFGVCVLPKASTWVPYTTYPISPTDTYLNFGLPGYVGETTAAGLVAVDDLGGSIGLGDLPYLRLRAYNANGILLNTDEEMSVDISECVIRITEVTPDTTGEYDEPIIGTSRYTIHAAHSALGYRIGANNALSPNVTIVAVGDDPALEVLEKFRLQFFPGYPLLGNYFDVPNNVVIPVDIFK